ncbi:MAG TPA: hypothetical protein VHD91_05785 [Gaiellaceae bacterium]|nr:hypothetical protein [Gaiellaceae bacterium]
MDWADLRDTDQDDPAESDPTLLDALAPLARDADRDELPVRTDEVVEEIGVPLS